MPEAPDRSLNALARIGIAVRGRLYPAANIAGVAWTALRFGLLPRYWPATVRDVLARQVFFTGVEAVRFVSLIALMVGLAVVVQAQVWLTKFGQTAFIGPLLVAVIIRELGPLLANFLVIGRSGTAITTELATMRVNGEIRVLDAQGLDPFTYLVLPRVIGVMISVFCLTIVFIVVSFVSGFATASLIGAAQGGAGLFVEGVFKAITPADVLNVIAKTVIPGALTGSICCVEGLGIRGAATEVPQAAGRAVIKSVGVLFVSSAIVSVITYL
jgi:phospholipid/cholesterol/gamma-HCH transport system permease protein